MKMPCLTFRCKRLGTQCWVYICIGCSELVLNLKFGREELFSRTGMSVIQALKEICIEFETPLCRVLQDGRVDRHERGGLLPRPRRLHEGLRVALRQKERYVQMISKRGKA